MESTDFVVGQEGRL